ncbi:hypothetical protein KAW18_19325 [candidate division WOR-3 bacterium]|nr:hypothetical protein [candidate division WOR-3 bacterium]
MLRSERPYISSENKEIWIAIEKINEKFEMLDKVSNHISELIKILDDKIDKLNNLSKDKKGKGKD